MDNELEQIIKERYKDLPPDLKKAVSSQPILEIMQTIALENGLHVDQAGGLYIETMLVLLGIKKVDEFEKNISASVGVDPVTVKNIEIAVNDKVFKPVRETLKSLQEVQAKSEEIADEPESMNISSNTPGSDSTNSEEIGSRDSLLAEIEGHMATSASVPNPATDKATTDFVGQRMTQTVSSPTQTAAVEPSKQQAAPTSAPTPAPQPKKYSADPYREPLS